MDDAANRASLRWVRREPFYGVLSVIHELAQPESPA